MAEQASPATPFSLTRLSEILKVSPSRPDFLISRENSELEFKESFSFGSVADYTRTCAAFANTKGGYLIFGIANSPRKILGLKPSALTAFERIDPEKISTFFNTHFAPEIKWEMHVHEMHEKQLGLLYVYESATKPVVCIRDSGVMREGDMYYRYRGQTSRIKYPELRAIFDERLKEEQRMWVKHLAKIARIGVRDAGIFDFQRGQVVGPSGTFVIDEALLSQLAFIKEGEFSEKKGKPTLKLIGQVTPVGVAGFPAMAKKQVVKTKGIRISDIILSFLEKEKVHEPVEYIKQICFESTAFLPVYYFIKLANLKDSSAADVVGHVMSRSKAKDKLVERLQGTETQQLRLPVSQTVSAKKKKEFLEKLRRRAVQSIEESDLICCLQALRMLSSKEVKRYSPYLHKFLKTIFNKYYSSASGSVADNLRRAICWVDEALYKVNN